MHGTEEGGSGDSVTLMLKLPPRFCVCVFVALVVQQLRRRGGRNQSPSDLSPPPPPTECPPCVFFSLHVHSKHRVNRFRVGEGRSSPQIRAVGVTSVYFQSKAFFVLFWVFFTPEWLTFTLLHTDRVPFVHE